MVSLYRRFSGSLTIYFQVYFDSYLWLFIDDVQVYISVIELTAWHSESSSDR